MQVLQYKVVLESALRKSCGTKWYWAVLCASFVVQSSIYWEVLCASFVVQSSTGKCFASFVVQSSIGEHFVQALQYKVVLGSALCKLCSTKFFGKAFLCKCICVSSICVQKLSAPSGLFCRRLLSDSKSFLACRTAEMS